MTDVKKLRAAAVRRKFSNQEFGAIDMQIDCDVVIEILDMVDRYREALVRARCEMLIVLENHSKVEMLSPLAIDEALEGGK